MLDDPSRPAPASPPAAVARLRTELEETLEELAWARSALAPAPEVEPLLTRLLDLSAARLGGVLDVLDVLGTGSRPGIR